MVVSGWAASGVTRPPTGTMVSPTSPLIGARMVPYSRLSLAFSKAPRRASTLALGGIDLRLGGEPGLIHAGLVGAKIGFGGALRGRGGVQILLGRGVLLHQRLDALVVLLGLDQVGLGRRQVGFGLQERNLLGGRIPDPPRSAGDCRPPAAPRPGRAAGRGRRAPAPREPPNPAGKATSRCSPPRGRAHPLGCGHKSGPDTRHRWARSPRPPRSLLRAAAEARRPGSAPANCSRFRQPGRRAEPAASNSPGDTRNVMPEPGRKTRTSSWIGMLFVLWNSKLCLSRFPKGVT